MKRTSEIGIIGLGKMGYRIAQRLIEKKYRIIAYDIDEDLRNKIASEGAVIGENIVDYFKKFSGNKIIILSVPASGVDEVLTEISKHMDKGDIILESGNSFYQETIKRHDRLIKKGIDLIDVGISGGITGARNGGCLMIGGNKGVFESIEELFVDMSKDGSYQYLGGSGSGHLVKGYHNFVEYGYLQSLAEGLVTLKTISDRSKFNISLLDVCTIWSRGSIVESRIVRDAKKAIEENPSLEGISGSVNGQTLYEMKKLAEIAYKYGVQTPACNVAIEVREKSLAKPSMIGKMINAIRNIFGGHQEWKK